MRTFPIFAIWELKHRREGMIGNDETGVASNVKQPLLVSYFSLDGLMNGLRLS